MSRYMNAPSFEKLVPFHGHERFDSMNCGESLLHSDRCNQNAQREGGGTGRQQMHLRAFHTLHAFGCLEQGQVVCVPCAQHLMERYILANLKCVWCITKICAYRNCLPRLWWC